jgi:hypothetical protein
MDPSWTGECPYCVAQATAREKSAGFKTRVEHPGDPASSADDTARKIAGVLVTFTDNEQGALFPLYEGKNVIGSGGASRDRPACDIRITTDPTMSREHALIRCLGGEYEIFDQKSQNGTYMNGQRVPVHGVSLEDQSTIKIGRIIFKFLMIRTPGRHEKQVERSDDVNFEHAPVAKNQPERRRGTIVETEDSPEIPADMDEDSVESPARDTESEDAGSPVSEDKPAMHKRRKRETKLYENEESSEPSKDKGTKTF